MLKNATNKRNQKKIPNAESRSKFVSEASHRQSDARQHKEKSIPIDENDSLSLSMNSNYEINCTSTRNFYLITNDIPSEQLDKVTQAAENEQECFLSSTLYTEDKSENSDLDTVRSGESLIKRFNFDTSNYNRDTNKCIAFWRTLMKTGLQPVKCTLVKSDITLEKNKKDSEESSENKETDRSTNGMWYKAIVELQRRKMDKVALAAVPRQCKLCEREEPYEEFKKKQGQAFSESELTDYEDITCLNDWSPSKKVPKAKDSSTNVPQKDIILEPLNEKPAPTQPMIVQHYPSENEMISYEMNLLPDDDNAEKPLNDDTSKPCHDDNIYQLLPIKDNSEEPGPINSLQPNTPEDEECQCNITIEQEATIDTTIENVKDNDKVDVELQIVTNSSDDCICDKNTSECGSMYKNESTKNKTRIVFENCAICQTSCKCWGKKIALAQRLIDAQRNELVNKPIKMDKSCGTETSKENKSGETKRQFCIICGHDDCNCRETRHELPKHLDSLQIGKNKVNPFTFESISKLQLHYEIQEQNMEDAGFITHKSDENLTGTNINEVKISYKLPSIALPTKLVQKPHSKQKKFFITPEQRAKEMVNKNTHVIKPDKYGIPQVVRYGNGRLVPKSATSEDIFSDSGDNREN